MCLVGFEGLWILTTGLFQSYLDPNEPAFLGPLIMEPLYKSSKMVVFFRVQLWFRVHSP